MYYKIIFVNILSDTMQLLDLAPPTKFLMRLKESGTAEKLFSVPGCIDAINDPFMLRVIFFITIKIKYLNFYKEKKLI